ncbi:MAG: hypothetical protein R6W90_18285 [Ignavibacteriaceae bacterium]
MNRIKSMFLVVLLLIVCTGILFPQENSTTHTRGKLWETLYNDGFIGDPGAWDYTQVTGIGFFPGFPGYIFPRDEEEANGFITDANFHNFRSGPWIIAKDARTPVPPSFNPEPRDFLLYQSSMASGIQGVIGGPFEKLRNFSGTPEFNPLLPEEANAVEYRTSTGIKVTQISYAWSFPGYDDFIIYDYTFTNTGEVAIENIGQIVSYQQTLDEVWFVFHSGIQVSTKGVINFHYSDDFLSSTAPAGSFGWHPGGGYTDYYAVENDASDGKGLAYYSRDYNGGRAPAPWVQHGKKDNWQDILRVGNNPLPELQDPAAFGFTFLYHTPPNGSSADPFDADPTYFNIYSDEGAKFKNKTVDFESFGLSTFSPQQIYEFATHSLRPANNGNLYCWYTSSFGPYTLAPGQSVRLVLAEVAGVMDLKQVQMGDPDNWYPDSTIADIQRNIEAARNAVKWGIGAQINAQTELAADVPEAPPAPFCRAANASLGSDTAVIAIQWDKLAEETSYTDGSGDIFYDGSADLDGYRIFRGNDKRGIWELIAEIPISQANEYWNTETSLYEYYDRGVQFGFEYYYYVQAYNSVPGSWTSANNTVVENLPELVSADLNRTELTGARPGPVAVENGWDVFVAPNPYVQNDPQRSFGEPTPYKIEFRNLPERAVIKIFSVSGDLVRTLQHEPDSFGNLFGSASWDQRSDSGLLVAPGLYIYVVESQSEGSFGSRASGKLMIIR